jgi:hypothetical protein
MRSTCGLRNFLRGEGEHINETAFRHSTRAAREPSFFQGFGKAGLAASAVMLFGDLPVLKAQSTAAEEDTANQIFQAAVIAEDLATTFTAWSAPSS